MKEKRKLSGKCEEKGDSKIEHISGSFTGLQLRAWRDKIGLHQLSLAAEHLERLVKSVEQKGGFRK